jgi:hypothetical protein
MNAKQGVDLNPHPLTFGLIERLPYYDICKVLSWTKKDEKMRHLVE